MQTAPIYEAEADGHLIGTPTRSSPKCLETWQRCIQLTAKIALRACVRQTVCVKNYVDVAKCMPEGSFLGETQRLRVAQQRSIYIWSAKR